MFIAQGFNPENKFWKYIVGSIAVIFVTTIGQIPFMAAIFYKTVVQQKSVFPTDQNLMMKILDSNLTLFLLTLSFAFGLLGLYFVIRFIHNQTLLSVTTARKQVDWNRIFFAFMLWALITIISAAASYFANPEMFVFNFNLVPFLILAVIAIIMIPIQTSCEEYIFRGYLMQGFANLSGNKWFPLLMTSAIFGLMHIANPEVDKMGYTILIYYIGTGLLLGIMTLMDDGLELSLGFHAANNLIGALLVTADWTVFQTHSILIDKSEPDIYSGILIPVFVIYPILLFIFSKKYNWNNWNEKLTGKIVTNQVEEINKIGENE